MKYKNIIPCSSKKISEYDEIAEDFFPKVFGTKYSEVLTTDESDLTDFVDFFCREKEKKKVRKKILKIYKLDIVELKTTLLVDIFEWIKMHA